MAEEKQKPKTKNLKARIRATSKYEAKVYWKTLVRFPKSLEQVIRENAGDSINGFIVTAVKEKLDRMEQGEK